MENLQQNSDAHGTKTSFLSSNWLIILSRIIVGCVFIFSGYVKMVDPLGTNYKLVDYFNDAFHMGFLTPLAFPLSFLLNMLEFGIGVGLLINLLPRINTWIAFLFMLVFTPLTFYLALADPVQDCGCFGDAIIMTNWETFGKNVVLLLFAFILFFNRSKMQSSYNKTLEFAIVGVLVVASLGFEYYNYSHLPISDFRPYKIGANIPAGMTIPKDAQTPEYGYDYTMLNKKTGETKVFDSETYINDKIWINKDWKITKVSEPYLIKEGYTPPIHDLQMQAVETNKAAGYTAGEDILQRALSDRHFCIWMVAYDLEKADKEAMKKANEIADFCKKYHYNFYCLTASTEETIKKMKGEFKAEYNFFQTDPITLKTIVRANPGYVILLKGDVVAKYHYNDTPPVGEPFIREMVEAKNRLREQRKKH